MRMPKTHRRRGRALLAGRRNPFPAAGRIAPFAGADGGLHHRRRQGGRAASRQRAPPAALWRRRGLLLITVIDYTSTNIGKYIEFSIAIAVTHGSRPAPAARCRCSSASTTTSGQYVYDLPVSTEISVKGGKGIWGMPKHQANLDFRIDSRTVSSQYDLDGQLAMRITIRGRAGPGCRCALSAANFCQFRGMLWKSVIYFHGNVGASVLLPGAAELLIGDSPRTRPPEGAGHRQPVAVHRVLPVIGRRARRPRRRLVPRLRRSAATEPEGLESVVGLGLSQAWLPPPSCDGRRRARLRRRLTRPVDRCEADAAR